MRAIRNQSVIAGRSALPAPCAVIVAALLACFACNDVGDCPAPATITPGGSCSGDALECPYTLASVSPACDGTSVDGGVATSCACTGGKWTCPTPVTCADSGDDGGGVADDAAAEAGVETVIDVSDVVVGDAPAASSK